MTTHFDEKGKIYTSVVSKDALWVILQTITHRIEGQIYARPGTRLKDEINHAEQFLAVTEAVVFSLDGEEQYRTDFLVVNRDHIIWLIPGDEIISQPAASPSEPQGGNS